MRRPSIVIPAAFLRRGSSGVFAPCGWQFGAFVRAIRHRSVRVFRVQRGRSRSAHEPVHTHQGARSGYTMARGDRRGIRVRRHGGRFRAAFPRCVPGSVGSPALRPARAATTPSRLDTRVPAAHVEWAGGAGFRAARYAGGALFAVSSHLQPALRSEWRLQRTTGTDSGPGRPAPLRRGPGAVDGRAAGSLSLREEAWRQIRALPRRSRTAS